ncbi:FAD-dependent monooxygenase (plasmid) [Sphingobium sp. SJ10-10]|uniref:FAD-dependent monooxygenase n=1 Tax=Sphingobium sp. SJ10-10 TaxID=3114999 RepID=UPI002E190C7D|nr:FAD-dependent monooxygenase [Sphingobium sp. SJ10-10]
MTIELQGLTPQVIIVGSGPVGLALAIELGMRSVPCLLIEKNDRTGVAPRAKLTNVRTREHLRRWGIAKQLADAAPLGVDYPSHIVFVTRLGGPLITRIENAFSCEPVQDHRYSEHAQWIPQYKLEAALLDHVATMPCVQVAMAHELVGYEQDEDQVSVQIRDVASGTVQTISAAFLIGADGARSTVRDLAGIKMEGTFGLSYNYNTIFEAPGIAEAHSHGPGIHYWQLNGEVPSTIGPMDVGDRWYFIPMGLPAGERFSDEEMPDILRRATGLDLPFRILSSDSWIASQLLADRYRDGRAFLIGDACHLHPPFGGYGMNMGVGDSVDLGWKLAAVLQGWGDPSLLDSYETERRPVHEQVLKETAINHSTAANKLFREGVEDPSPEGDRVRKEVAEFIRQTKPREFYSLNIVLGYSYSGSPIIVAEQGDPTEWVPAKDYNPSARAGSLAPHRWLGDGSSLYDRFGMCFTMLVLDPQSRPEADRVAAEAGALGVPLGVIEIADPEVRKLYEAPLALIRPDQHVAWRGSEAPADLLKRVTGHSGTDGESWSPGNRSRQ